MKTKGQSRGHCQVCGRIQVVLPGGLIAKHGYTVPSGYFRGICQGSAHAPLQVERILTDAIILAMRQMAQRHEDYASDLMAGTKVPEQAQQLTAWGSREYTYEGSKQISTPVMKRWGDATEAEQDAQLKLEIGEAESQARFARSHAESLLELAARVHGQPLIDRDAEELARVNERKAKRAPIPGAFRTKIAQKRELEALNNRFSKLRRVILDRVLNDPARDVRKPLQALYWDMPYDLCNWRAKHVALVLDVYPDLAGTVEAIETLVINRKEIKAMPVIK